MVKPLVDRAVCAVGDAMHSIVGKPPWSSPSGGDEPQYPVDRSEPNRATVEQILRVPARGAGPFIAVQRPAARTLRGSSWPWVDRGYQCVYGARFALWGLDDTVTQKDARQDALHVGTLRHERYRFPLGVTDGCCANPQRVFIPPEVRNTRVTPPAFLYTEATSPRTTSVSSLKSE